MVDLTINAQFGPLIGSGLEHSKPVRIVVNPGYKLSTQIFYSLGHPGTPGTGYPGTRKLLFIPIFF